MSEPSNKNFEHNPRHSQAFSTLDKPTGTSEKTPLKPETPKKKWSLKNTLLVGGAGIALVATAAGVGISASNSGEKPPTETETSAPIDSGNEFAAEKGNNITPEYEFTADLMSIPAGLSDEEYAVQFLDKLTKWNMAGATDETYVSWQDSGYSDTIQSDMAAQNLQIVKEAHLFSPDGLNDSNVKLFLQNETLVNEGYLQGWLSTYNQPGAKPTPGQLEAFNATQDFNSVVVVSTSSTGRELIISGTQHNNASQNMVGQSENIVHQNGLPFEFHITTTIVDGFEEISTITN